MPLFSNGVWWARNIRQTCYLMSVRLLSVQDHSLDIGLRGYTMSGHTTYLQMKDQSYLPNGIKVCKISSWDSKSWKRPEDKKVWFQVRKTNPRWTQCFFDTWPIISIAKEMPLPSSIIVGLGIWCVARSTCHFCMHDPSLTWVGDCISVEFGQDKERRGQEKQNSNDEAPFCKSFRTWGMSHIYVTFMPRIYATFIPHGYSTHLRHTVTPHGYATFTPHLRHAGLPFCLSWITHWASSSYGIEKRRQTLTQGLFQEDVAHVVSRLTNRPWRRCSADAIVTCGAKTKRQRVRKNPCAFLTLKISTTLTDYRAITNSIERFPGVLRRYRGLVHCQRRYKEHGGMVRIGGVLKWRDEA